MNKATKIIIAGVSSAALAGGIGAGLAYADPTPTPSASPTASASPSASPTAQPDRQERKDRTGDQRRGLMAKALHGEATLAGKKHRVVVFQRGPVDKISDNSLTVKSKDGFTASYAVTPDTKVRKQKTDMAFGDLKVGDRVRVVATKDGSTVTAVRIRARGQ